jgi:hypothetical protein
MAEYPIVPAHAPTHAIGGDDPILPSDIGAQPADSDLTALAALSTTAFGRALLELADAAAARAAIGAVNVAGDTITGDITLTSLNQTDGTNRIHLSTYERDVEPNEYGEVLRLQWLASDAKPVIAFQDEAGLSQAWLMAHEYLQVTDATKVKTFAPADYNTSTNVITVTAHGFATGDQAWFYSTGALPNGILFYKRYYVRKLSADTLAIYRTSANASADTNRVASTATGSGTHTIDGNNMHHHVGLETKNRSDDTINTRFEIVYGEDNPPVRVVGGGPFVVSQSDLFIVGDNSTTKNLKFGLDESAVYTRFAVRLDNTTEAGANVGSDFRVVRYSDVGAAVDTPFFIKRSNGFVGIGTTSPGHTLDVNGALGVAGKISNVTDPTLAQDAATKAYVDALLAAKNAMVFLGGIDCSGSPNYPAASTGDTYSVTVAGKVGGASGESVKVKDLLYCIVDGTVAGDQATVGANWIVTPNNDDGQVIGPAKATDGAVVIWDGTGGKLVKDSSIILGTAAAKNAGAAGVAGALLNADDPTTTNARTPTAHAASHKTGGSDPIAASDIGAQSILKSGIAKISAGAQQFGIPAADFNNVSTAVLTINEVRYILFKVKYPVTLIAQQFEVTSAPASDAKLRVGIYLADTDLQPTGAPVYDLEVAVASGFTGLKTTSSISVPLAVGNYLSAINCNVAMTLRSLFSPTPIILAGMGSSPFAERFSVAQTYPGSFPNPGTKWTALTVGTGLQHLVCYQWTE